MKNIEINDIESFFENLNFQLLINNENQIFEFKFSSKLALQTDTQTIKHKKFFKFPEYSLKCTSVLNHGIHREMAAIFEHQNYLLVIEKIRTNLNGILKYYYFSGDQDILYQHIIQSQLSR